MARHVNRPRLLDWHDEDGHILVIGEAAYILNVSRSAPYWTAVDLADPTR